MICGDTILSHVDLYECNLACLCGKVKYVRDSCETLSQGVTNS